MPTSTPSTKQCPSCREHQPLDAYGRDARSNDGQARTCKPCARTARAASRAGHGATPRPTAHNQARAHLAALLDELDDHQAHGHTIPCRGPHPAAWISDDEETQRDAARACTWCPALDACAAFAHQHPREAGVYGGTTEADRRPRPGRPRAARSAA